MECLVRYWLIFVLNELDWWIASQWEGLDDIKVDVKSPNGTYILGTDVTPYEEVDLIQNWLKEQGLY